MKRSVLIVFAAVVLGGVLGAGIDRAVLAQQSGIKRTVLLRTDDPGSATYEAVMGIAELAPGANSGKHFHHGVEVGYVLEGTVVVEQENKPGVTMKAGETFKNDGAAIHEAKNPGGTPTKILAVYIVEKGKPLAEPAR